MSTWVDPDPFYRLEVMSLNPTAQDSSHGFNTAMLQIEVRTIHAFSGSLFLTSDGIGRLHFWDIENPQMKIELRNSEQVRTTGAEMLVDLYNLLCCQAILDVIMDAKFALIVKLHTLELFALPSLCPPSNDARHIILNPLSSYQWPWRIDNVSMTTRFQPSKNSDTYDSIGILVRYGSLFPWVSKCGIKRKNVLFTFIPSVD